MSKRCFVYILANEARELYVGVITGIERRLWEHRNGHTPGYASAHGMNRLVYWEQTANVLAAIAREKQIKGMRRRRKLEMIERMNPGWRNLDDQIPDTQRSAPSLRSG